MSRFKKVTDKGFTPELQRTSVTRSPGFCLRFSRPPSFLRATTLASSRSRLLGDYIVIDYDQYRICFHWERGYADEVEITDYH